MTRREALNEAHPCADCDVSEEALCRALDTDTLADFRHQGVRIQLAAGQPLFHQGDPADHVFSLTRGVIKLYAILPDGRRQVVAFLFPGDFIGVDTRQNHGFSAEAVSSAVLCRFLKGRFERFAHDHPALADARYRRVAGELAFAQDQIVTLGRKTAVERLAGFLYDIHQRAGLSGRGGAMLVPLPMSRGDIADYLGLRKETISRGLRRMRALRIIWPHSLTLIEILDLPRIRDLTSGMDA